LEKKMRVFVTGASGWIGSATVDELLAAGHEVVGLARSDASATAIAAKGASVLRGDLDDPASLRCGADRADAVVHLANKHDWADPAGSERAERSAVEALASALVGSDRPLVVANGLSGVVTGGRPARESDPAPGDSEDLALGYVSRGVRTIIVRFAPSVHGAGDWGFVTFLADAARRRGVCGYIGDGTTAWSAVHRTDAARLIRLGVERAPAGTRMHAVAEESITTRAIAEALGAALGLPAVSDPTGEPLGFVGSFFGRDMSASSTRTRDLLDWVPTGPTLVEDILSGAYGSI
jgi:nucleoside-diphosphate-sugar epimerase